MSNFVINIFQEQFNLIENLPDNEKKEVLYILIQSKFNQDDCFEKQSRLSTSTSLSNLSLSVIDIISKTMRVREMNDNHGGSRKGAGAPKGNNNANKIQVEEKQSNQSKINQKTIKLIDLQTNKLDIPEYLLKTDSYEELTSLEREIYDNVAMRELLNKFWAGQPVKSEIGELYLKLIEDKMKQPRKQFKKPNMEEIKAYCAERKNSVNPVKWFDHYESNGWKVGKNPMKDWQAAIRKWENSDFNKPNNLSRGFVEDNNNTFLKSKTEY